MTWERSWSLGKVGVKRDGEKQQAWLRREVIVYVKWKGKWDH